MMFRPGILAIWLQINARKASPLARRLGRTVFRTVTGWKRSANRYMSAFSFTELHVLDPRALDLPPLKSDVCKQGPSRKVKTPQPRGKKRAHCADV